VFWFCFGFVYFVLVVYMCIVFWFSVLCFWFCVLCFWFCVLCFGLVYCVLVVCIVFW
jgi:hypothetical protein